MAEEQQESNNEGTGEKTPGPVNPTLAEAREAIASLEKERAKLAEERAKMQEQLDRAEELKVQEMLSGKSQAGTSEKTISPREYAEKVMAGEIE